MTTKENNGWIKIESEDDLPKGGGDYWVFNNNKANIAVYYKDALLWEYELYEYTIKPTHYQPIIKLQPPIY